MSDGLVEYGGPPLIAAYAVEWEIVVTGNDPKPLSILKF